MVFSSIEFLFLFLPVVFAAYWLFPRRLRNGVLLAASLGFYTWGGGAFVFILVASVCVDYFAGWLVDWARENGEPRWKAVGVAATVVVNLALLGYFKYADFFVQQINNVGDALGFGAIAWDNVGLPIGISFFTFQSMSYTIDVSRGRVRHLRNPLDFALYVALFPQLIAGPIVRYHEVADQIRERHTRWEDFAEGAIRFSHGLAKKVIIADAAGVIVDAAFGARAADLNFATAWVGVIAFTIQIYFDFSGYSDMAIGLGRIFGFTFPENFRRPYSAISITDFWRRWHITLSAWFRDYLYIPLGGSRGESRETYRNLIVVFALTGLWHGAAWTFVLWGGYHGLLLIIERVTGERPTDDASVAFLRRAIVLVLVMLGWVIFRADSVGQAQEFYRAMFSFNGFELLPAVSDVMTTRIALTIAAAAAVVLLPRGFVGGLAIPAGAGWAPAAGRLAVMGFALPYAMLLIAGGTFSPFLYFRF